MRVLLEALFKHPHRSARRHVNTRLRCDRSFPRRTGGERGLEIPDARQAASAEGIAAIHTLREGEVRS